MGKRIKHRNDGVNGFSAREFGFSSRPGEVHTVTDDDLAERLLGHPSFVSEDGVEQAAAEAAERLDALNPETRSDLDDLSYRELQLLAKQHDVTANSSHDVLTEDLADELDLEPSTDANE